MYQIDHTVTIVIETCCNCGVPFGFGADLQQQRKDDGANFYCPNGHPQHYTRSTQSKLAAAESALKTAQENARFYKDEAERKARQLSATRGVLTRTKNRIHNGVCPCCNRQFVNLARHMNNQHPDYSGDNVDQSE